MPPAIAISRRTAASEGTELPLPPLSFVFLNESWIVLFRPPILHSLLTEVGAVNSEVVGYRDGCEQSCEISLRKTSLSGGAGREATALTVLYSSIKVEPISSRSLIRKYS